MAQYNEILVGRYNRAFQKSFGMKGPAPAPQLSTELQPSVVIPTGVEERYIQSWSISGAYGAAAAVAAQNQSVRLRNPLASNIVMVVERLTVWVSVATEVQLQIATLTVTADLSAVAISPEYDIRFGEGARASGKFSVQSNAALIGGTTVDSRTIPLNTNVEFIGYELNEIPIGPGGGIQLDSVGVNLVMSTSARWRERFLEESERARQV